MSCSTSSATSDDLPRKAGSYRTLSDDDNDDDEDEVSDPEDEEDIVRGRNLPQSREDVAASDRKRDEEDARDLEKTGDRPADPPSSPPPAAPETAQYGIIDPDRKGYIRSPYMRDKLIDARGIISGTEFACPYTDKRIKMP